MTATFSDTHVRLAMTGHWNGFTNWTTELFSVSHVCPQKQCVSFITVLSKAAVTWSGRKIVVQHKSLDCPPFIQSTPVVLRGPKRSPNNRFPQFAPKSEESVTTTPPSLLSTNDECHLVHSATSKILLQDVSFVAHMTRATL